MVLLELKDNNIKKLVLGILILLSVFWIIPGCQSSKVPSNKEKKAVPQAKKEPARGNLSGNIVVQGSIVQDGEWIYYADMNKERALYKMKLDGSEKQVIDKGKCIYLNLIDGWLYYVVNPDNGTDLYSVSIVKMKVDGTEKKVVSIDTANDLTVVGDWVYYVNFLDGNRVYKVKTDGTERQVLNDDSSYSLNVAGDWLYYKDMEEDRLYRIGTDGKGKKVLVNGYVGGTFNASGDWVYYPKQGKIWKTKFDGSQTIKFLDSTSEIFIVDGDWVYYEGQDGLHRIKTDGTGKEQVIKNKLVGFFNIVGDWIYYYRNVDGPSKLYRVKKDGTGATKAL